MLQLILLTLAKGCALACLTVGTNSPFVCRDLKVPLDIFLFLMTSYLSTLFRRGGVP